MAAPTRFARSLTRRHFLEGAAATSVAMGALGAGRQGAAAQPAAPYPDWIPASPKPPKRGGVLTRASLSLPSR